MRHSLGIAVNTGETIIHTKDEKELEISNEKLKLFTLLLYSNITKEIIRLKTRS